MILNKVSGLLTAHLVKLLLTYFMKHCLTAFMMAVVLLSCVSEKNLTPELETPSSIDNQLEANYLQGEARVYLSEELVDMVEHAAENGTIETKSAGMNAALAELGITEMYRLFPHAGEYEERTRAEGLHRWYVVKYSHDVTLTKAQVSLEQVPGIDLFEPVRQIKINDFNDLTSDLWGLLNQSNPGFDINVKPVWDEYTVGNPDVIVSVVDDGIDLKHEDLADNCLASNHYNAVSGTSYINAGDHGTHVAGIIAAVNNNGKGVASVAGGDKAKGLPGVKLMSCQIFQENSDGTTTGAGGAAAIKWGADHGAVISQNSWGYTFDADGNGSLEGDELTKALNARISASDKAAVDYFIKYAGCDNKGNQLPNSPMKGGVVIFAAGNDNIAMGAPAEYDQVIAVGSVASNGTKSTFSNYGDWVDVCAPGTTIMSTVPGNQYQTMSGTSMACPHVSGVAALIVSYFGGPGFTNEMLKEKILNSANYEVVPKRHKIGGLVDTYGAFVYGNDKAPAAVADLAVSGRGNNIDLELTTTDDEDGKPAYGYLAIYGHDMASVQAATPNSLVGVESMAFRTEAAAGTKVQFVVSGVDFESQYYVKVLAYSYGRSYSAATEVFPVMTTENHPPVVTLDYDGDFILMSSQTLNIPVTASDPDGHAVEVKLQEGSGAETLTFNPDGRWRLVIKGTAAEIGSYLLKIVATDEFGMSSVYPIAYEIKENSAPEKLKDIEDVLLTAKGREFIIDMAEYVHDPDGEQLKYDIVAANSKIAFINVKGDKLIGTALAYGSTDMTIIAKDARGEKVVFEFKVTVKDPSDPLSVYPNPVKDYLNVATLDMAETSIDIYNSTGKLVYSTVEQVSATEPLQIDMRDYAPGTYSVQVAFGGKEYRKNVVKL